MPEKKERSIIPHQGGGVFQDLALRIKLIVRLMADRRVSPWLKLMPIGSLLYLLFPDIAPGPIDDAAIIWLGFYLFVELCPPQIVEEHMKALRRAIPAEWHDVPGKEGEEEIIEAEFHEEP